jgi:lambda family phage portal protein
MSALSRIRRSLGRAISGVGRETMSLRRWDAAKTDRLNEAHYNGANGQHINTDIATLGQTVQNRASRELSLNAIFQGIVRTHVVDVVGPHGPQLQVLSDSQDYNDDLEGVFEDWAIDCDAAGMMALPDMISLWVLQLWPYGEYLVQKITDPAVDTPIRMRLNNINPPRLNDPLGVQVNPDISLGVKRNKYGRAETYFVAPPDDRYIVRFGEYDEVPARDMIHWFVPEQANQARGVPWIAAALQTLADLHEIDRDIMDAIRQAANFGVVLWTDHPDSEYISVNESTTLERGTMKTAPPGWTPEQVTPQQPGQNVTAYINERKREAGASANMPLLKINRDASGHNYSSARFDDTGYWRGNDWLRAGFERNPLRRTVLDVEREARLAKLISGTRPKRVRFAWRWAPGPHIDQEKEAKAEQIALETEAATLKDIVIGRGKDWEQHQKDLLEQDAFEKKRGKTEKPAQPEQKVARALGDYVNSIVVQAMRNLETEPTNGQATHL